LIALIQRVTSASVTVEEKTVAEIGAGILALVGVERGDREEHLPFSLPGLGGRREHP